jgi:hypothetical protein
MGNARPTHGKQAVQISGVEHVGSGHSSHHSRTANSTAVITAPKTSQPVCSRIQRESRSLKPSGRSSVSGTLPLERLDPSFISGDAALLSSDTTPTESRHPGSDAPLAASKAADESEDCIIADWKAWCCGETFASAWVRGISRSLKPRSAGEAIDDVVSLSGSRVSSELGPGVHTDTNGTAAED